MKKLSGVTLDCKKCAKLSPPQFLPQVSNVGNTSWARHVRRQQVQCQTVPRIAQPQPVLAVVSWNLCGLPAFEIPRRTGWPKFEQTDIVLLLKTTMATRETLAGGVFRCELSIGSMLLLG
eukprot:5245112-Amphidinium_carterae.3